MDMELFHSNRFTRNIYFSFVSYMPPLFRLCQPPLTYTAVSHTCLLLTPAQLQLRQLSSDRAGDPAAPQLRVCCRRASCALAQRTTAAPVTRPRVIVSKPGGRHGDTHDHPVLQLYCWPTQ